MRGSYSAVREEEYIPSVRHAAGHGWVEGRGGGRHGETLRWSSRMAKPFVLRRPSVLVVAGAIALASTSTSSAQTATKKTSTAPQQVVVDSKPWKGDFDGMLQRRRI